MISKIENFYLINKRIPTKREFNSNWSVYLRIFGSWNNAIKSAGFETNQERFTHKYAANDGHICDSLSEKIIDDWLTAHHLPHLNHIYYPNQHKFKTDFLVKNKYWLEFLGLRGELESYDEKFLRKLKIAQKNKIKITELRPQDLFPHNHLSERLAFLLK